MDTLEELTGIRDQRAPACREYGRSSGGQDMVPADVRLVASRDLFVAQAALTGESLPVEKFDARESREGIPPRAAIGKSNCNTFILLLHCGA